MTKIKKIFNSLKEKHSNAVLFWNGLLYGIVITLSCIDWHLGLALSVLGSVIIVGFCFEDDVPNHHLWIPMTIIFWIFVIVFGITNSIVKFNKWLNKK